MKAIHLTKFGKKNCYKYYDGVLSTSLGLNEVRISIKYFGISFTDLIIQKGLYKYQKDNFPLPYCPGFEFSGVITGIHKSVKGYTVGEEVIGISKHGSFADEIVISEKNIIKLPKTYSLREASTFPVNYFTAYHALHGIVKIRKGATVVLIMSAGGGVGGMLVQISKALGYTSVALISDLTKEDYVKSLGADYTFQDNVIANLQKENLKIDIVFDNTGTFNLTKFRAILALNAKIVVYGFNDLLHSNILLNLKNYFSLIKPNILTMVHDNITVSGFNIIRFSEESEYFQEAKKALSLYLESGKLIIPHIREYRFGQIEEAVNSFTNRKNYGKVIVKV